MQGLRDEIIKILNARVTDAIEKAADEIMEKLINQDAKVEETVPQNLEVIDNPNPKVRIERYLKNGDCVLGKVYVNNVFRMFSGERADLNNQRNISCIPVGKYRCTRHITANYPEARRAYAVNDVPNRTGILFHSGNIPIVDSQGCILLGMSAGKLAHNGRQMDAVLQSRDAMENFHQLIQNRPFDLEIVEV